MSDHKLVLKNTIMLYLRMFVTLAISLLTTRIVFNALGLSDIGIYNVVGGVLSLLGILNNTLAGAAQRFLSFDLGGKNLSSLKQTFATLLYTQIMLCIIITLIAESLGLWFVNNKLILPEDKIVAANWVYQTAIISMALGIIKSPFTASIIAHEKMSIYAYFAIIDVIIKLLIVVFLLFIPTDKLITYALLLLLSAVIDFMITILYCIKKFDECSFHISYNKGRFSEIFSFSGWTLLGQSMIIANEQVVNIFINRFNGTIANGSRDIAGRVNGMVSQFIYQFQTAINPPIIKSYAQGDYLDTNFLINMGCKISFILMFIISFPIIIETSFIFKIWLGSVPEYSVGFLRLILLSTLMDSMTGPISKSIQATGKIKKTQIYVSLVLALVIPLSYIILFCGYQPYMVYSITIATSTITLFIRIYLLSKLIPLSIKKFVLEQFLPCIGGAALATIIIYVIKQGQEGDMLITGMTNCFLCVIISVCSFYLLTLNRKERKYVSTVIHKLIR